MMPRQGSSVWRVTGIVSGTILIVLILVALLVSARSEATEAKRRSLCLNSTCQIMLAMIQYAGDYDNNYPSALVDDTEAPQRRFARLLKGGYLNATKVFRCWSDPRDKTPDRDLLSEGNLSESTLSSIADTYMIAGWCSYGVDTTIDRTHSASRAVIADKPAPAYWGPGVNSPAAGLPGSNSENHKGNGQSIAYNDGHFKWSPTCGDDVGIDPNIYAKNPEMEPCCDSNVCFGTKP